MQGNIGWGVLTLDKICSDSLTRVWIIISCKIKNKKITVIDRI